ncbi:MAG: recombination protein RecA [Candidatus Sumerlaeota bacterium]|nr:recombination protein RecA [Candidatus Sumerlaeota bacterium]
MAKAVTNTKANNPRHTGAKEREKALDLALTQVRRNHGEGIIRRFGENTVASDLDAISSGSISLDRALGSWGFPRGRIIEVFGPESSGKTTVALHAVASAQAMGGTAAFIDVEHAMDPAYTKALGVNLDELLISQPDYGEQALDIVETLVKSNAVDIVVVDSVAALVPRAELEGEIGDSFVGLQARLMSQALRKLTGAISQARTAVIFINQIREKIGVMFGSPETTPGGRALKFYCSIRLDVRRIGSIKENGENVGNRVRVRVVKNKVAPPFREAEFDIEFGKGISREGDLIDLGILLHVIDKSGSWISYKGERLGQGRENSKNFLRENPALRDAIEREVKEACGVLPVIAGKEGAGDAEAGNGASAE